MKQDQKDFINDVILPVLIKKAIDGSLPSDMTELSILDFEGEIEKINLLSPLSKPRILVDILDGCITSIYSDIPIDIVEVNCDDQADEPILVSERIGNQEKLIEPGQKFYETIYAVNEKSDKDVIKINEKLKQLDY
jgi:hypothetical protein